MKMKKQDFISIIALLTFLCVVSAQTDVKVKKSLHASPHMKKYLPKPSDGCDLDICAPFTGFFKASCCFDFTIIGDSRLVTAVMNEAQKERDVQIIINNTAPVLLFPNAAASLDLGISESFDIIATDPDPDTLFAIMERSDRKLFELKGFGVRGEWTLTFIGTQLPGNYEAEVMITDGIAWTQFTVTVVVNPPCLNDKSYRYKGDRPKSCIWVGMKKRRRQNLCSKNEVRTACRMTCGLCCKDNASYTYTTKDGIIRNCAWTGKKPSRSEKYCKNKKIKSNCPITCDNCKEKYNCVNNENFRYNKKRKKSCAWIGESSRRVELCADLDVRENCPTACGLCCEDNQNYLFEVKDKKRKGCEWVAKTNKRTAKYCKLLNVRSACPSTTTCNKCLDYVQPS